MVGFYHDARIFNWRSPSSLEDAPLRTRLAGFDKIQIIDRRGAGPGGGMTKVMSTVGGGMTAMFGILQHQFGIDVAQSMQPKPGPPTARSGAIDGAPRRGRVAQQHERELRYTLISGPRFGDEAGSTSRAPGDHVT